jgi:anti-anti-sigma factor
MSTLLRTEVHLESSGVVVIRCMGELDMSCVGELIEAIEWSRTPELRVLRIETKGLDFIDSSGLHCLMDAQDRCQATGVRMELAMSPAVERLVEVAGIVGFFNLQPEVVGHRIVMTVHTPPRA